MPMGAHGLAGVRDSVFFGTPPPTHLFRFTISNSKTWHRKLTTQAKNSPARANPGLRGRALYAPPEPTSKHFESSRAPCLRRSLRLANGTSIRPPEVRIKLASSPIHVFKALNSLDFIRCIHDVSRRGRRLRGGSQSAADGRCGHHHAKQGQQVRQARGHAALTPSCLIDASPGVTNWTCEKACPLGDASRCRCRYQPRDRRFLDGARQKPALHCLGRQTARPFGLAAARHLAVHRLPLGRDIALRKH